MVSLGVAVSAAPEERSVLFRRLEDVLHRTKGNGRNCIRVESEPFADADKPGGAAGEMVGFRILRATRVEHDPNGP